MKKMHPFERNPMRYSPMLILWLSLPLAAQTAAPAELALRDAVRLALEKHPSVEASVEQGRAASTRIQQARSGYLPRVNYSESFQTSNNPVFVFGTLLTQRRFAERRLVGVPVEHEHVQRQQHGRTHAERHPKDGKMLLARRDDG